MVADNAEFGVEHVTAQHGIGPPHGSFIGYGTANVVKNVGWRHLSPRLRKCAGTGLDSPGAQSFT